MRLIRPGDCHRRTVVSTATPAIGPTFTAGAVTRSADNHHGDDAALTITATFALWTFVNARQQA
jgi:hypothetical protein